MKGFLAICIVVLLSPFFVFNHLLVRGILQPPQEVLIPVPHHWQYTSYNCGPAALEMVFDYYGPDINQSEIGDVCRTEPSYGTYNTDMERAAHFSNLSTSVGSQLPGNVTGYTGRSLGYAAFLFSSIDMDKLKTLLAEGYPLIMLWDWHYRVCVGYDSTHFFFQNSLMGKMEKLTYQDFLVSWSRTSNSSLFISPWQIEVSAPRNVSPGNLTVTAKITYPCPAPFIQWKFPSHNATATIILPEGLNLAPTESAKKTIGTGDFIPMQNAAIAWNVQASTVGHYDIVVEAEGIIEGHVWATPSGYPEYYYSDRIGGQGNVVVAVTHALDTTPPTTSDDYDRLWHNQSFTINLSAYDENSGVMETHYRMNDNQAKTIDTSGQPTIDTESADNTLEYWSVDWAGNEEFPHKILTGIKLDKTPPTANAGVDQTVSEDTVVTFDASASTDENGIATYTWTFTDVTPQTLSGEVQTYTFVTPGTYIITLEIADPAGNSATDTVKIIVLDITKPIATAGSDRTVNEDTVVTLDGSASSDNIAITTYTWTLTDITTKTLTGEKPTYTFNTPGAYTITLNVTDGAGNWATDTVVVTVLDTTKPAANAGQDQSVNVGASVFFDASGSTDNVGAVDYEWDFGDGSTGTGKATTHTYTELGTYIVTLTVKDAAGNSATHSITVTVLELLELDLTKPIANAGPDQTATENTLVTFSGSQSSDNVGVAEYTWTFRDVISKTLHGVTPSYNFTTPGTYTVTLTVKDAAGNTATDTVTITVLLDTDRDKTPNVSDTDDDNDGMPDSWETQNGLNPLDAADASLDPDGDGLTNLQEYQTDKNPNVSDAQTFPTWVIGAAVATVAVVAAIAFLWKRQK